MHLETTQELKHFIEKQALRYCRINEGDGTMVAQLMQDDKNKTKLVDQITDFCRFKPNMYIMTFKPSNTSHNDRKLTITYGKPTAVQTPAGSDSVNGAAGYGSLYQQVSADLRQQMTLETEMSILKAKNEALESQVGELSTFGGKFAQGLETLVTKVMANKAGEPSAAAPQLQGHEPQAVPSTLKAKQQALLEEYRRNNPGQEPAQEPEQQVENATTVEISNEQQILAKQLERLCQNHTQMEVVTMIKNIADACEAFPGLFEKITPDNLKIAAPFL